MSVAIANKVSGSNGALGPNGTVTVAGLTTGGASLILVTAAIGNNTTSTVSSVTVGGAAAIRANTQVMPDGFSHVETWAFWSSGALSAVSVAVTFANSNGAGAVVIVDEATGTDSNSVGNLGNANGTSGTSAASATCSASGSVMYASTFNFGGADSASTNTSLLLSQSDGAGDFVASAFNNQVTTAGSSFTATTTHGSGAWAMSVVEIKPPGGPPQPFAQPDPTQLRPARNPRSASAEPYHTQPNVVIPPPLTPNWSVSDPYVQPRSLRHEAANPPVNPLPAARTGISFVGSAVGTTSATLPGFRVGDIAVVHAFRSGSVTAPTLPAGWTSINTGTTTTTGARIGYRILQAGDTTTGTWTNATRVTVTIYRGQSLAYGNGANPASATSAAVSTTVTYPALTLTRTDGTSWVLGLAGHTSANTTIETPPAGMVVRADSLGTAEAAAHDTGGGVASWSSTNVSVGGTSSGWVSFVVEIAAEPTLVYIDEPRQAESRPQRPQLTFEHAEALPALVAPSFFGETSPPAGSRESDPRVQMSAGAEARPAPVVPTTVATTVDPAPAAARAPAGRTTTWQGDAPPPLAADWAPDLGAAPARPLGARAAPWPADVPPPQTVLWGFDPTTGGLRPFLARAPAISADVPPPRGGLWWADQGTSPPPRAGRTGAAAAVVPPPQTVTWGFDPSPGGLRPFLTRAPAISADVPVAGGGAWWADQAPAQARPPARAPAPQGDVPPPQTVTWGFDPSPVLLRPSRAEHRGANVLTLPPPPFAPTGFDGPPAPGRALSRALVDAGRAPAGLGAPWVQAQAAEIARAARRQSTWSDGLPAPTQAALAPWGFDPALPHARPAAPRRLHNGEPLPARALVVFAAWGFDLPPAARRAQEASRRFLEHVAGLPALAARPGVSVDASAPSWRVQVRIVPAGAEAPSGVGQPWGWDAGPAPSRQAPRSAAAGAEAPPPSPVVWVWESGQALVRAPARPQDAAGEVPGLALASLPSWGHEMGLVVARAATRLVVGVEISVVPASIPVRVPARTVGPVVVLRARLDPAAPVLVKVSRDPLVPVVSVVRRDPLLPVPLAVRIDPLAPVAVVARRDPLSPVVVTASRRGLPLTAVDFTIGQDATEPSMLVQFLGADGKPEDLRGQTLTRRAKLEDGSKKAVVATAVAVDPRNGLFRVDFTAEDTKVAGRLLVDFVSSAGGRVRPADGWLVVQVKEALR